MYSNLKKICLWVILAGAAIALLTPLIMDSSFFFPFITSRAFLFRIVVGIMLLAYLYLAATSEEYRPRLNVMTVVLTLFVAAAFVSSLLGPNFYRSFWGDMERSEGLLLWLHLWAFFVILTAAVKQEKHWLNLLDVSVGVGVLVALFGLGQMFGLESILSSGERVDATFGNPSFLAAYLFFQMMFAGLLFWKRKFYLARYYYPAAMILFAWIALATQTRGAALGLAAGVLLAGLLFFWGFRRSRAFRWAGLAAIVFVVLSAGLIYAARDSGFVQETRVLKRLVSISPEARTAQTRLATWDAAWEGWRERFWLGWGIDQFNVVFNKNFPPEIYEDEGSVVWFDRAHNMILDRGTMNGIVGLVLLMTFLLYPAIYLAKRSWKDPELKVPAIIIASFTAAYIIQNLFVFESIIVFIFLFFALAFFTAIYLPAGRPLPALFSGKTLAGFLAASVIAFFPLQWKINIHPARVNLQAGAATRSGSLPDADFFQVMNRYKDTLKSTTYGSQEYRLQLIEYFYIQAASAGELSLSAQGEMAYVDEQAERQIAEGPEDAKNFLLVMRYYNFTHKAVAGRELARLDKALEIYEKLVELSPTRPPVYQEAGNVYLNLHLFHKASGELAAAGEAAQKAEEMFKKTIDLNPLVIESHTNLVMLYLNTGEEEKVRQAVADMEERVGEEYITAGHLRRLLNLAVSAGNFGWAAYFAEKRVLMSPDDPDTLIDAAVANAHAGNRVRALEIADRIVAINPQYANDVKIFVDRVNSGFYEQNP